MEHVARETVKVAMWQPADEPTLWGDYRDGLRLADVLEAAATRGARRVMLCGDAPPADWFIQPAEGWTADRLLPDHETPAARFSRGTHIVEVRRAAEWFGRGNFTRSEAEAAWRVTAALLRRTTSGACMFRSPGATGLDLFVRAHRGEPPAPIADELQELIRTTTPQHRIELYAPRSEMMPALWVLDGRWMYAALTRELGSGPAMLLTREQAEDRARDTYARGRYRVRFKAPDYWRDAGMPGIFLSTVGDDAVDGWHSPLDGVTWCDAAELHLAREYGWQCDVLEGIALVKGRPLDTWTDRLVRARELAPATPAGDLARNAIRAILLHSIGSFHARGRQEQTVTDSPMQAPAGDGWEAPVVTSSGRAIWRRDAPAPNARQIALRHPELSAAVWGRAHARIMESRTATGRRAGIVATRPDTLVSVYGDALMTTRLPDWAREPDDGKPGRLRVKGHLCGPIPWPRSAAERDELTRLAGEQGNRCTKGCSDAV